MSKKLTYEQRATLKLKRQYEKDEATALLYAEYEKLVEQLNEKHVECEAYRELVHQHKTNNKKEVTALKNKLEGQKEQIKNLLAAIETRDRKIKELEIRIEKLTEKE